MSNPVVIVTGDDLTIPVTLKKNGETFAINVTATVGARIVGSDHKSVLSGEIEQSSDAGGADWAQSLVVVVIPSQDTKSITYQGKALLEIQVDDGGKRTWFVSVNIVKGNIT